MEEVTVDFKLIVMSGFKAQLSKLSITKCLLQRWACVIKDHTNISKMTEFPKDQTFVMLFWFYSGCCPPFLSLWCFGPDFDTLAQRAMSHTMGCPIEVRAWNFDRIKWLRFFVLQEHVTNSFLITTYTYREGVTTTSQPISVLLEGNLSVLSLLLCFLMHTRSSSESWTILCKLRKGKLVTNKHPEPISEKSFLVDEGTVLGGMETSYCMVLIIPKTGLIFRNYTVIAERTCVRKTLYKS